MHLRSSVYGTPKVSWVSADSIRLSISQTPFPFGREEYYLVVDNADPNTDQVDLEFELSNLPLGTHLLLEDLHTGSVQYLNNNQVYKYTHDTSAVAERLKLYVSNQRISIAEESVANQVLPFAYRLNEFTRVDRIRDMKNVKVTAVDLFGSQLYSQEHEVVDEAIELPSPSAGMYMLVLEEEGKSLVIKVAPQMR